MGQAAGGWAGQRTEFGRFPGRTASPAGMALAESPPMHARHVATALLLLSLPALAAEGRKPQSACAGLTDRHLELVRELDELGGQVKDKTAKLVMLAEQDVKTVDLVSEETDVVVDLTSADPTDAEFDARVKAMELLQSELTQLETKQAVLDGRLQRVKSTLVQTSCTASRR